ncbi:MAG: hypothetical protein ACI8P9_004168 [Parasphingorhabdus sp.]|jgi:hypothetical protein
MADNSEKTLKSASNANDEKSSSRRRALATTVVASSALLAGRALPKEWVTPMVESVLLPAHAQTTSEDADGDSGSSGGGGSVQAFALQDVPGGDIMDYFSEPAHASPACGSTIPTGTTDCCLNTFGALNGPYQFLWEGVTVNGSTDAAGNMSQENFTLGDFTIQLMNGVASANGQGSGDLRVMVGGAGEIDEEACVDQVIGWSTSGASQCIL